jgi:hypothetical protein
VLDPKIGSKRTVIATRTSNPGREINVKRRFSSARFNPDAERAAMLIIPGMNASIERTGSEGWSTSRTVRAMPMIRVMNKATTKGIRKRRFTDDEIVAICSDLYRGR